ncbi:MAG: hypothetical protein KBS95_08265 [Alistipes sp.]|nr:hypothetical protein [Candidatus Alistipes equi]
MENSYDELTIIRNEFMQFKGEFREMKDNILSLLKHHEKQREQLRELIHILQEILEAFDKNEHTKSRWDDMEYIPTYKVLSRYNISRKYLYYYRMEHGLRTKRIGKTNYYLRSDIENMGKDITFIPEKNKEKQNK